MEVFGADEIHENSSRAASFTSLLDFELYPLQREEEAFEV